MPRGGRSGSSTAGCGPSPNAGRLETEVLSIHPREDAAALITYRFVVRNQRDRDVLVAELKALVAEGPAETV